MVSDEDTAEAPASGSVVVARADWIYDERLVEALAGAESDVVLVAPEDGVISKIHAAAGETIQSEQLLASLEPGAAAASPAAEAPAAAAPAQDGPATGAAQGLMGPAARQLVEEHKLDPAAIAGTGKGGRVTKEDVLAHMQKAPAKAPVEKAPSAAPAASPATAQAMPQVPAGPTAERVEKRVPMTRMRARIAERLLEATRGTAMLTTFNEVNMAPVMALREKYKDQFEKTHNGTRLGFMGFFVKACCEALKRFPEVNASIDGNDVVYHGYQDIGVAVSTPGGLVVPVLRDADFMSLADVEAAIRDLGLRARDNKLSIDDMTGGTFTVTNGGVFGSLLSTPILNPPQTGILGMHKIQERPMAVNGQVVIQPMMYLALSYDHRLIDGKTAVQFLVAVKDLIEDPARILLQL